jgi:opacity protein-like surface antigen
MKKILFTLLLAASVAASSRGAVIVGTDVGYLFDSEEAYYAGRLGFEFHGDSAASHQLEVEVGYTESRVAGGEASLLPVTLNYRFVTGTTGAWGYYAGLGAGFARTHVNGVSTGGGVRLRDESFAAQAFAGVEYRLTPVVALTAGLRYIWVEDVTLASTRVEVGDDVAASVGLRFKF